MGRSSLSKLAAFMAKAEGKIAVLVGTVTDDVRLYEVPKLKVCALKFTETARARIVAAGGECMTFDQLATVAPTGATSPHRPEGLLLLFRFRDPSGWAHAAAAVNLGAQVVRVHLRILPRNPSPRFWRQGPGPGAASGGRIGDPPEHCVGRV
jgi:hypothetical protein